MEQYYTDICSHQYQMISCMLDQYQETVHHISCSMVILDTSCYSSSLSRCATVVKCVDIGLIKPLLKSIEMC